MTGRRKRHSIITWPSHAIDDQNLDRRFTRFQLQTQLVLHRGKQGWPGLNTAHQAVLFRLSGNRFRLEIEREIEPADEPGFVDNRTPQARSKALAERAIEDFLRAIGHDPRSNPHLAGTGARVAEAWLDDLLSGETTDVAALLKGESLAVRRQIRKSVRSMYVVLSFFIVSAIWIVLVTTTKGQRLHLALTCCVGTNTLTFGNVCRLLVRSTNDADMSEPAGSDAMAAMNCHTLSQTTRARSRLQPLVPTRARCFSLTRTLSKDNVTVTRRTPYIVRLFARKQAKRGHFRGVFFGVILRRIKIENSRSYKADAALGGEYDRAHEYFNELLMLNC